MDVELISQQKNGRFGPYLQYEMIIDESIEEENSQKNQKPSEEGRILFIDKQISKQE